MALLTHRDPLVVGRRARAAGCRDAPARRRAGRSTPSIRPSGIRARPCSSTSRGRATKATRRARARRPPRAADGRHVSRLRPRATDDRAARGRGRRRRHRDARARHRPRSGSASRSSSCRASRPHHRRGRRARPVAATRSPRPSARRCTSRSSRAVAATHRADLAAAAGVPARDNDAELDFWADYLDWSSSGSTRSRARRRARVVSRPPTGDRIRTGAALGRRSLRQRDLRRRSRSRSRSSTGTWRRSVRREHDVAWFTTLESTMRTLLRQRTSPDSPTATERSRSTSRSAGTRCTTSSGTRSWRLIRSTAIMARIGYLHRDAGLPSPLPIEDNPLLDLLAARIADADG